MSATAAIISTATCLGELRISPSQLAATYGTTEAAILRSLGGRELRATARHPVALAAEAAEKCLEMGEQTPGALDAIVWLGKQVDGLRFQAELGAAGAFLLCISGDCAEYLSGIIIADGLIQSGHRQILVCTGEHYPVRLTDTSPTEQNYRNLLGDSGSALLLHSGPNIRLLGHGFASRGAEWSYLSAVEAFIAPSSFDKASSKRRLRASDAQPRASELPFYGQVFRESFKTTQIALERCLASSGLQLSDVDSFCFPSIRHPNLVAPVLRMLGIPAQKFVGHTAYAHLGKSDVILDLEQLTYGVLRSAPPLWPAGARAVATVNEVQTATIGQYPHSGRTNSTAVIVSTGIGVSRCIAIRIPEPPRTGTDTD